MYLANSEIQLSFMESINLCPAIDSLFEIWKNSCCNLNSMEKEHLYLLDTNVECQPKSITAPNTYNKHLGIVVKILVVTAG